MPPSVIVVYRRRMSTPTIAIGLLEAMSTITHAVQLVPMSAFKFPRKRKCACTSYNSLTYSSAVLSCCSVFTLPTHSTDDDGRFSFGEVEVPSGEVIDSCGGMRRDLINDSAVLPSERLLVPRHKVLRVERREPDMQ